MGWGLSPKMNPCGYCNITSCMKFETIWPNMEQTASSTNLNATQWKPAQHMLSLYALELH